jgi:hypothetical protein
MEWIARARISRSRYRGPAPAAGSGAGAALVGFAAADVIARVVLLVAMMITF